MINETTSRALTDLMEINRMATEGYETATEKVEDGRVKSQLSQFAQQRAQFQQELHQVSNRLGMQPEDKTTIEEVATTAAAAVHRGWINLKSLVTGASTDAILGECETGDATALAAYETALKSTDLAAEVKEVLQRQHGAILQAKNQVTALKSGGAPGTTSAATRS